MFSVAEHHQHHANTYERHFLFACLSCGFCYGGCFSVWFLLYATFCADVCVCVTLWNNWCFDCWFELQVCFSFVRVCNTAIQEKHKYVSIIFRASWFFFRTSWWSALKLGHLPGDLAKIVSRCHIYFIGYLWKSTIWGLQYIKLACLQSGVCSMYRCRKIHHETSTESDHSIMSQSLE